MSFEHTRLTQPQLPFHTPRREGGLYDTALRNHHIELRRKFSDAGADALSDVDMLELLLLHSAPRKDTRPLAQTLIDTLGGLEAVLSADMTRLEGLAGPVAASDLKLMSAAGTRMARTRMAQAPLISSWDAVITYCRAELAHKTTEEFRVLFLNKGNRLIADECLGKGTVDHVPVYPREVLKRALDLHACAIILVHNHPSGDPTPSECDISMTKQIKDCAETLSITLHDHLIVGAEREVSMMSEGLI